MNEKKSQPENDGVVLTPEQKRARRSRSVALALTLAGLAILFFIVTMAKGPAVLVRPI
jgi:hypothetical protein